MSNLIFFAGGECLTRHGVLVRRTSPAEEVPEIVTRSGTIGWLTDVGGVIRNSDANEPRVEWIDGLPHLLLEAARTNLILQSEVLATTWVNVRSTDAANSTTAPDGETTADTLIEDATADSSHYIYQDVTKATSAIAYAFSVYAKAKERSALHIKLADTAGTDGFYASFDLAAGTVIDSSTGTGTGVAGIEEIVALADDWYRLTVTGVSDAEATIRVSMFLKDDTSANDVEYSGDGASGLYLFGMMLEGAVAAPSSYIPTTTVARGRGVDGFYSEFLYPPQAMTVYVKFVERGTLGINAARLLQVGAAGASTDPRFLVAESSGKYLVQHDNGTISPGATLATAPAVGDTVEIRAILNTDGSVTIGQSINSAAETTASDATTAALQPAWADTRLYVNSGGASSHGVGAFAAIKVARGVKSMAEMRAL